MSSDSQGFGLQIPLVSETLVQNTIAHHHSKSNFSEQEVKNNVCKLIIKRLRTGTSGLRQPRV